jgi:hypothetical protein
MRGCPKTAWLIFVGLLPCGCLPSWRTQVASEVVLAQQQGSFFDLEQSVSSYLKP